MAWFIAIGVGILAYVLFAPKILSSWWPSASSALQPRMRVAPAFQLSIRPALSAGRIP